jgi:hypothetical protein
MINTSRIMLPCFQFAGVIRLPAVAPSRVYS